MAKLQIFTCWSLSAPTVGAVHGEDAVHSHFLVIGWPHFSTTFTMAGSSDMTRFGLLEFLALPPVGMQIPPIFEPS